MKATELKSGAAEMPKPNAGAYDTVIQRKDTGDTTSKTIFGVDGQSALRMRSARTFCRGLKMKLNA